VQATINADRLGKNIFENQKKRIKIGYKNIRGLFEI